MEDEMDESIVGRIRTVAGLVLEVGTVGDRIMLRAGGGAEILDLPEAEEFIDLLGRSVAQARPPQPAGGDVRLDELVSQLARVFDREDEARTVMRAVGLPNERIPRWDSPHLWWSRVMGDVKNGATRGGVGGVVREALRYYRANPVFLAAQKVWP